MNIRTIISIAFVLYSCFGMNYWLRRQRFRDAIGWFLCAAIWIYNVFYWR